MTDPDPTIESGRRALHELKPKIKALKDQGRFGDARLLLRQELESLPGESGDYVWCKQQLALCTYQDSQLRPEYRHRTALEILRSIGLNDPEQNDPETLGRP